MRIKIFFKHILERKKNSGKECNEERVPEAFLRDDDRKEGGERTLAATPLSNLSEVVQFCEVYQLLLLALISSFCLYPQHFPLQWFGESVQLPDCLEHLFTNYLCSDQEI